MLDIATGRKKDKDKDKIYIIKQRISSGKVKVVDRFGRGQIISAGESYRVGTEVLVVSGVLVREIGKLKVVTYQV